jgi:4-amino-4-deoxy-L-arabinose transferase-like glycosyltransferase
MAIAARTMAILRYGFLAAILAAGILLRVHHYDTCPRGLNQDEASIGYDAFSIAEYGVTRNGESFPVHFIGWGSGQAGLYHYLIMPFIKVFGLSEGSVRAGNLLAQTASILLFFLLMTAMGKPVLGLMGSFLIAVTPWSIVGSRWGFEAYLLPVVILAGVFLYVKAFRDRRFLPWSFAVFALSLYAYSTAYFFIPLFAAYLIYHARRMFPDFRSYSRNMAISLCAFILVSIPIGCFFLINVVCKSMSAMNLLGMTISKLHQSGARYEKFIFMDSRVHDIGGFLSRLGTYFRFYYETIFLQRGPLWCVPEAERFGCFYQFSTIFLVLGILICLIQWVRAAVKKKSYPESIFVVWFAIASIMGLLSEANTFRMSAIYFVLYYFIAKAIYETSRMVFHAVQILTRSNRQGFVAQWSAIAMIAMLYIGQLAQFYPCYISLFSGAYGQWLRESLGSAIAYADTIAAPGESIYFTDHDPNTLYVYVLFYEKVDPRYFMKNVVYVDSRSEWRPVSEIGRFRFIFDKTRMANPIEGGLYVARGADADRIPLRPESVRKDFKHYSVVRY